MVRFRCTCLFFLFIPALSSGFALLAQTPETTDTLSIKQRQNTAEWRTSAAMKYQRSGCLLAWCDSVGPEKVAIHRGPKFTAIHCRFPKAGIRDSWMTVPQILQTSENWLTNRENNGFPFATLKWELHSTDADSFYLFARASEGDFYLVDSLIFGGTAFSKQFIRWSGGVVPGEPYNHQAYLKMLQKWSLLEGISVGTTPQLQVLNARLQVRMPVVKTNKDYISGLVGLATQPNGRPVFTGEFGARLYNLFGAGVYTGIEWRSFRARSQQLKVNGLIPYLFGVPFELGYQVGFEKFDTLFSNFSRGLEFRLPVGHGFALGLGVNQTDRFRIFADTQSLISAHVLPANPPMRFTEYHLGIGYNRMAKGVLPENGGRFNIRAGAGQRRFVRDPVYESFTWQSSSGTTENAYDSLSRTGQFKVSTYRLEGTAEGYLKLHAGIILKLAAEGYYYRAPRVYFNELQRYGGIKNLRGFFEQSIFANQFCMSTMELRFQSSRNGYFGPFWHLAWYRDQSGYSRPGSEWLQGMGLAAALRTKAGVLNMAWALGKKGTAPVAFNQSRFHFGISTDF